MPQKGVRKSDILYWCHGFLLLILFSIVLLCLTFLTLPSSSALPYLYTSLQKGSPSSALLPSLKTQLTAGVPLKGQSLQMKWKHV